MRSAGERRPPAGPRAASRRRGRRHGRRPRSRHPGSGPTRSRGQLPRRRAPAASPSARTSAAAALTGSAASPRRAATELRVGRIAELAQADARPPRVPPDPGRRGCDAPIPRLTERRTSPPAAASSAAARTTGSGSSTNVARSEGAVAFRLAPTAWTMASRTSRDPAMWRSRADRSPVTRVQPTAAMAATSSAGSARNEARSSLDKPPSTPSKTSRASARALGALAVASWRTEASEPASGLPRRRSASRRRTATSASGRSSLHLVQEPAEVRPHGQLQRQHLRVPVAAAQQRSDIVGVPGRQGAQARGSRPERDGALAHETQHAAHVEVADTPADGDERDREHGSEKADAQRIKDLACHHQHRAGGRERHRVDDPVAEDAHAPDEAVAEGVVVGGEDRRVDAMGEGVVHDVAEDRGRQRQVDR